MTLVSALAYCSVALAAACWGFAAASLPAERRWRRAGGVAIIVLFVGAVTWMLVFSAGMVFLIVRDAGGAPMPEIATAVGGLAAAAAGALVALRARSGVRA